MMRDTITNIGNFMKNTPLQKNLLLLSGSRAMGNLPEGAGKPPLFKFAEPWIKEFFAAAIESKKPVLFVPYARPDAMAEATYFSAVKKRFDEMGIPIECAPEDGHITREMLQRCGGIFVGGGHTYTLLDKLQSTGSLEIVRTAVEEGLPYMGSSAGTVIACPTIKTTNDMPGPSADKIDLNALGLVGFQINPHYMDNSMHDPKHMGESRDTRLKEVSAFNPGMQTLGLYEGQAVRVNGDKMEILTSENYRGTKPPVFHVANKGADCTRTEIECEVGEPKDVSRMFAVREAGTPHRAA